MSEPQTIKLPVDEIEASASLQVRCRIDPKTVAEYAEAMRNRAIFPPVVVFAERGSERYLLADGYHRLPAFKENGIEEIACELHEGGLRDALAYALRANDTHGLRRSAQDKRNAVMMALKDPEWGTWSAADISRLCRVSDKLVARVREDLVLAGEIEDPDTVKTQRGGKIVEQKARYGNSEKSKSSKNSKKSVPPPARRQPKSLDESNRDECFAALSAIRHMPHDGAEAVHRWNCGDRLEEALYCRDWLNEFIEAIQEKAA